MYDPQDIAARTEAYAFAERGFTGPIPDAVQARAKAENIGPKDAALRILSSMLEAVRKANVTL